MIVNLRLIPEEGVTVTGEEDPAIIDVVDPSTSFHGPITYRLRLMRTGRILVIRGSVETTGSFTCSRCLKEFTGPIRVKDFGREKEIGPDEGKIGRAGYIVYPLSQ